MVQTISSRRFVTVRKLLGFTVTACVSFKCHGKHRYLPLDDWRGRKAWLEKRANKHGFQIVGVGVVGKAFGLNLLIVQ